METMTIIALALLIVAVVYHYGRIIRCYWSTRKINNECIVMIGTKPMRGCKVVELPNEDVRNTCGVRDIWWDGLVKKQIAKYNPRAQRPLFIWVTEEDFSSAMKQLIWLDYSPGPTPLNPHRGSGGTIIIRGGFQKTATKRYGLIGSTEEYTHKTVLPKRLRFRPEILAITLVLLGIILLDAPGYLSFITFVIYSIYVFIKDKE